MSSIKPRYLLDLNALIAFGDPDHEHHQAIQKWFISSGNADWGVCPLTEAGFVRVTTNPNYQPASRTIQQATAVLADFATHPGYRYWPIADKWAALTAPFLSPSTRESATLPALNSAKTFWFLGFHNPFTVNQLPCTPPAKSM